MANAAPIPIMNSGTIVSQPAAPTGTGFSPPSAGVRSLPTADQSQLNKYIYDYFLRSQMWDCARALLNVDNSVGTKVDSGKNGSVLRTSVTDDVMDTDGKEDCDQKSSEVLPPAAIANSVASDSAFLYEWFCLFWDMFHAQRHKNGHGSIHQYVSHTQVGLRVS